jgi:short chain dehydrogenase
VPCIPQAASPIRPWCPEERETITTIRLVTPFTAKSTAADVVVGIDLSSRRAIVTGGASGIGIETARALTGAGAEVTIAVRNVEAGNRTAEDIAATTGNARVRVAPLDLSDRASWHRSSPPGMAHCIFWSTTPA